MVRNILDLPKYENLVVFIAIGDLPDNFMLANSYRSNNKETVKIL